MRARRDWQRDELSEAEGTTTRRSDRMIGWIAWGVALAGVGLLAMAVWRSFRRDGGEVPEAE